MLESFENDEKPSSAPTYIDFSALPSTSVGEIHFGDLGPLCARQGWAVFPQQREGRKPGVVDGDMLKWSKYQDVGPDVATVDRWSRQAWGLNVAAIMGSASAFCFTIDVDVTDRRLSFAIQLAAARTLGETKFQRIGNFPKIALIYRVATREEMPANRTLTFMEEDGSRASEHAVEFQGQGKAITILGRHHTTGERFIWPTGRMPLNSPPDSAPIVTAAMLDEFIEAMREIRPIQERAAGGSGLEGMEFIETNGVRKPQLATASGAEWVVENGIVVDGREKYLTRLAFETVRASPLLAADVSGIAQLKKSVTEAFRATALLDGKWKTGHLPRSIAEKVGRNARQLLAGEIGVSKRAIRTAVSPATETQKAAVALGGPEVERISAEMRDRVDEFWDAALSYDPDSGTLPPFHLLKSPVGTGKTTIALASTLRTLRLETVLERKAAGEVSGTIGMLLPSHQNVDEVLAKARALGLRAVAHRGQAHEDGGCQQRDIVATLQSAGISASKLCESKVDGETVYCEHNPKAGGSCPRIAAIESMLENDLVVSVHAYGLREPPRPFKDFAAVIVDENLAGGLIGTALLDRKVLDEKRRAIMPTQAERKELWGDRSPTQEDLEEFDLTYSEKRYDLVELCKAAWNDGRDPAFEIAGDVQRRDWLDAAQTIASRAARIAADINPKTTLRQAAELAKSVHGRGIGLEAKLWKLLHERVEAIEASRALVDDGNKPVVRDLDDRIWPFRDEEQSLQLSWNGEYSLSHLPTLFMDASANPRLLAMTLGRSPDDIVCRPIEADLRLDVTLIDDNTYTKRRFFPGEKASQKQRSDAAKLMRSVRMFLAKTGAVHGDGGVLFVAPLDVEEAILDKWTPPANMESMHFGATAGLDWAKRHSAAVLIGALYPDVVTIDGLVAALTYRDPVPTERMDPDGTGAVRPFEMVDDAIPLRDGTFHAGRRLEYPTVMANDLLVQIRDEQLVQALGRLRSVYREDTPRLYILGNAVPRGLIVDRVSTMQREAEDMGDLLSAAHECHDVDQRVSRELAERRAMTVPFRRFTARIDADPDFAKAFHCITSAKGERSWLPAYVDAAVAKAHAMKAEGTVELATVREYGRPKYERFRKGPSRELQSLLDEMIERRLYETVPLQERNRIRDEHGSGAQAQILAIAREADAAWKARVEVLREEHRKRPPAPTDDPFQFISIEALAIPVDW